MHWTKRSSSTIIHFFHLVNICGKNFRWRSFLCKKANYGRLSLYTYTVEEDKQTSILTHSQFLANLSQPVTYMFSSPGVAWLYLPFPPNYCMRCHTSVWPSSSASGGHFLSHNLPVLAHMKLSWQCSYLVCIILAHTIVFEIYLIKKKKKKEKRRWMKSKFLFLAFNS